MANASALNAPFEALFDRTAVLSPDVTTFSDTITPGSYTVPPLTQWLEIVLIGGGGCGGHCLGDAYHGGAGGGGSGELLHRWVRVGANHLVAGTTLSVYVGTGATRYNGASPSYILDAAGGDVSFRLFAAGGSDGVNGGLSDGGAGGARATTGGAGYGSSGSAAGGDGANSGAGDSGDDGEYGYCVTQAPGGAGGTYGVSSSPGHGGRGGFGYGAGGGGAGGSGYNFNSGPGGGGGGGGGYGGSAQAGYGDDGPITNGTATFGSGGVQGIVVITAWRGAP